MLQVTRPARRVRRSLVWAGARLVLLLLGLAFFWRNAMYETPRDEEPQQQEELGELAAAAAAAAARALTGEPPALHGMVPKTGPLHESRWHPRHTDYINHKWGVWMKKRRAVARRARPPSVLSPHVFPGCAVLAVSSLLQAPLCAAALAAERRPLRLYVFVYKPWCGGVQRRIIHVRIHLGLLACTLACLQPQRAATPCWLLASCPAEPRLPLHLCAAPQVRQLSAPAPLHALLRAPGHP